MTLSLSTFQELSNETHDSEKCLLKNQDPEKKVSLNAVWAILLNDVTNSSELCSRDSDRSDVRCGVLFREQRLISKSDMSS